jgi:hypothetical protein
MQTLAFKRYVRYEDPREYIGRKIANRLGVGDKAEFVDASYESHYYFSKLSCVGNKETTAANNEVQRNREFVSANLGAFTLDAVTDSAPGKISFVRAETTDERVRRQNRNSSR